MQRKWKGNSFWNLNWSFFKEGRSCSSETLLIGMKLSDASKGWEINRKEKVGTVFKGFHKTIINFYLTVNNVFALKVAPSLHFLRKNSPSSEYFINQVMNHYSKWLYSVKMKRAGTCFEIPETCENRNTEINSMRRESVLQCGVIQSTKRIDFGIHISKRI